MRRFAFTILIVIVAVSAKHCHDTSTEECEDQNEFWNKCGSYCEPMCIKPQDKPPCDDECVPKCSCKPGFVIGTDGKCISKEDCTSKIKCRDENQYWNKCGSNCEARCMEPQDKPPCDDVCVPKCSCKPGFVIGTDGKCISKDECSSKKKCHGKNQYWNKCGSNCEERCMEPENKRVCPAMCVPKCSCKPGFVIGPDGDCISKKQCSLKKTCRDENQFWNKCGNYCEPRCVEPEDPPVCAAICVQKCSCKPGYLIGTDGKCISEEECHNCSE